MKKIYAVLIITLFLGAVAGVYYFDGILPAQRSNNAKQIFVVPKGANVNDIINKLSHEKLIRNKIVFLLIVKQVYFFAAM